MSQLKIASAFILLGSALVAQTPQYSDQPHPWRRADAADEQAQFAEEAVEPPLLAQAGQNQAPPPPPVFTSSPSFNQGPQQNMAQQNMQYPQQPQYNVPARLSVRPGTFVTARVNDFLSSDRNQQGDSFFATLAEPLVVDGIVVAQRGQTVMGRVTEARKAGRTEGTARLALELTGMTLVDGQQIPLQSQMIGREGGTSVGRDAGAIATTTALGALIGASADYGRGAAIGAGAGAAAGIIGVLLTRGHASEVYPETALTFRLTAPVEIVTDHAPQAFRYAEARDYGHEGYARVTPRPVVSPGVAQVAPYYYEPYYGYPYYSGFSFGFGTGYYPYRYYGGRSYYGGGYRGGVVIRGGGGGRRR